LLSALSCSGIDLPESYELYELKDLKEFQDLSETLARAENKPTVGQELGVLAVSRALRH
jgi:hypothetical protein